jgi:hypothetical protein
MIPVKAFDLIQRQVGIFVNEFDESTIETQNVRSDTEQIANGTRKHQ